MKKLSVIFLLNLFSLVVLGQGNVLPSNPPTFNFTNGVPYSTMLELKACLESKYSPLYPTGSDLTLYNDIRTKLLANGVTVNSTFSLNNVPFDCSAKLFGQYANSELKKATENMNALAMFTPLIQQIISQNSIGFAQMWEYNQVTQKTGWTPQQFINLFINQNSSTFQLPKKK
jgi:hypothetical protein